MVNAYNIEAISIGNGASRETESLLRKFNLIKTFVFVVSEAGVSV
jgi:transcriptional accessory protein Tex/SPT6